MTKAWETSPSLAGIQSITLSVNILRPIQAVLD